MVTVTSIFLQFIIVMHIIRGHTIENSEYATQGRGYKQ